MAVVYICASKHLHQSKRGLYWLALFAPLSIYMNQGEVNIGRFYLRLQAFS